MQFCQIFLLHKHIQEDVQSFYGDFHDFICRNLELKKIVFLLEMIGTIMEKKQKLLLDIILRSLIVAY